MRTILTTMTCALLVWSLQSSAGAQDSLRRPLQGDYEVGIQDQGAVEPMDKGVQAPMQKGYTQAPMQKGYTQAPVQKGHTQAPIQKGYTQAPVQSPVQKGMMPVQAPIQKQAYQAPIQKGAYQAPIQKGAHHQSPVQKYGYDNYDAPVVSRREYRAMNGDDRWADAEAPRRGIFFRRR